ncbi:Phytoene dehydrogenase-related protein [Daejeonella rubra]|uniref:Phytoene dehydrogenase-related protein n=1 Tax=Daejeonella rubra TaxID=990371 RepID=A0A1G9X6M8_9SPHI|nr:NAD(P)/FAD-dependent oxidoreductase [Daejeonella rubra]SDM92414.1 Phytoene dehydrogenase-related protein [Daejeonella rubra]
MKNPEYDAVVIGSGPNGLSAAITLQQAGLTVLILEAKQTIGGGLRSEELTLPGFIHDVCSAIHPLAAGSPFFNSLPLEQFGLEFIYPEIAAAHPFDGGTEAVLKGSVEETASKLGIDTESYLELLAPLVRNWTDLAPDILAPLHYPKYPLAMVSFGLNALKSASFLAKRFKSKEAKGLWAGMAAHSMQSLSNSTSAAAGLVLLATGHAKGWPVPKGGSKNIAQALASYFISIGGKIETGAHVKSMSDIPSSRTLLFDLTPKQILEIAGEHFSSIYKWQLKRYRYGMGVFKIDWALDGPIPFTASGCLRAGTVHLGNTFEEIAGGEQMTSKGKHPEKPFVLMAQQSIVDPSRAPQGKHTAWGYCHVPNGSEKDMTAAIEKQVERFAPGFRDLILAKHTMNTKEIEVYNPNYIGGDINGGVIDMGQLFTRPALRTSPYRTSAKGIYICSSSTPPGGGVHGMCGYRAAKQSLKDVFNIDIAL